MATTFDHLVTKNIQSDVLITRSIPISSIKSSLEESILDLSQRSTTNSIEQFNLIDNWRKDSTCNYTDNIDEDLNRISVINETDQFNIEQPLTDQLNNNLKKKEYFMSDNQSQIDFYCSTKKSTSSSSSSSSSHIVIHELVPCLNSSPYSSLNFIWSKYLSLIGERSVSDEFFDHYLASIQSGFKIDMKIEYCYDIKNDLYWLTQIQLVSHCLILLHYIGLDENNTLNDFWANIYDQRCHPVGWCQQNSKVMLPPPILPKEISLNNDDTNETPADYLFDKEIGLTPVEQLKIGMLLEIQDINRPWTLWFVRIINNCGGRLHLRYIIDEDNSSLSYTDIHIFYLDYRVHFIGWTSKNSSVYSYDLPTCLKLDLDKQSIIDKCLNESLKQFSPLNLFKEQEEIVKHRFTEGMKLEIFQSKTQNIYIGKIGLIHNEYYFDVIIDNDDENQYSFVGYSTHPYILPAHWAAEHKLVLMNGKNIRQSEDYWNSYTEKNGLSDLAPERCFNLITLNITGTNKVEPGMKMEMIYTLNNKDYVFSVTLIHIIDHLMWLRIDNTNLFYDNEQCFYHVLPINSLDVFPVGWAKFNGFELITPMKYQMEIQTYQINRYNLFSSVTHYPKIPRVYLNEIYQLTIYVNIRCYSGPHLCSSRLARIPSQFGPGPYRHVLIDMFHHLLSATSTNSYRALRRLDHQINTEKISTLKTEYIKAAKKSAKLIRPISIPNEPRFVYQYLRHICTQLEACPNLISIKHIDNSCPDKCHILSNTFVFSTHSKHKRTQLRAAQNRYRKQKSLLCHLKTPAIPSNVSSPIVEELPSIENSIPTINHIDEVIQPITISLPGSDRQTRGFRVHIEPKTHTVTRTNRKQKILNIKQEPIEINTDISSLSTTTTTTTTNEPKEETKRSRLSRKKRSLSPLKVSSPSVTLNILSSNQNKKKRRPILLSQPYNDFNSSSNTSIPKIEVQSSPPPPSSSLIRSMQYPVPPPIDPRNPITWNVNDVCWYLNQVGCSFALKTIKEQEIDGAALLLLDDLDTVQNLLEFKLGPAVKFFHVVEQLRTQVIERFHSSPSLKTSTRLSTK